MDQATVEEQLGTQVTRRRIVKTGIKVAYAAPLVAATFKVTAGALAQEASPPTCVGGQCLTAPRCNGNRFCVCYDIGGGSGFCHKCQQCATVTKCPNGQDDCAALGNGSVCSATNCCGEPVCLQPCNGSILTDCVSPPQALVRTYEVAGLGTDAPGFAPAAQADGGCGQTVC